jgi:hypothetical protein
LFFATHRKKFATASQAFNNTQRLVLAGALLVSFGHKLVHPARRLDMIAWKGGISHDDTFRVQASACSARRSGGLGDHCDSSVRAALSVGGR